MALQVDQLTRYSVRSPTRSELLWGEWEIVYCSNPTAPGGPFRSGPGRALFANQRIRQSLQKPDTITNNVEFKTLGLLPGSSPVAGDLKILDGQRYEVISGTVRIPCHSLSARGVGKFAQPWERGLRYRV